MSTKLGSEPAYPPPDAYVSMATGIGLTKRELLAAMAMQGILADCTADDEHSLVARAAVGYADALLAELARSGDAGAAK